MRLKVTEKYLLKVNRNKVIPLIIIAILFLLSFESKSQTYKINYKENTSLSEALLESSKSYGFKVAFDAQRLAEIKSNSTAYGNSIDEFVGCLLLNSGYSFLYKHGCYLIVEADKNAPEISTCQLTGSVLDGETGEQLPFASVILPAQNISASTTSNGTFSLTEIVSNPMHVVISYIGYYQVDTLIFWKRNKVNVIVKLHQKDNLLDSVNIKGEMLEMIDCRNDLELSTVINPSKLIDLPIVAETDIFKTLQLLPGVSFSENSSELSIRGGTSDQNLVLFDDQTLYSLSHFYGVFSSINPNIIKDIRIFKGGFDSRYGERISGIVDITGKSGNQSKPTIIAGINLLSANLAVEIPVSKKITLIAAARRTYSDIYSTFLASNLINKKLPVEVGGPDHITIISEPKFYFFDINSKINYKISNNENISLSLFGGKDFFNNSYNDSTQTIFLTNVDSNLVYNYGASARWQKQWNKSFFTSLSIGTSGYMNESSNLTNILPFFSNGPEQPFLPDSQNIFTTQNTNELRDYFITTQNNLNLSNFNLLNFGFLVRYNSIYYHKDADKIYVYDNFEQSAWLASIFLQDRITFDRNLSIKPGFRISYFGGDQKIYFEPRFAATYNFTDKLASRLALGRYYQFISQVTSAQETGYNKNFWVLTNDSVNPVLKSDHYILGLSYRLKSFLFDVEAYIKKFNGIQEYIFLSPFTKNTEFDNYFPPNEGNTQPDPPPEQPSYFIDGSGKTYGIDFFIKYKNRFFTSWLSYTISKSSQQFNMINLGKEIPSLTDHTHQLSFSNLFTVGKWNFGATAIFSTGRPFISFSENKDILPITRTYSRMPDFFRLDVSTNYNFKVKAVRFKTGVSLINLLNSQNYYDTNVRTFNFNNSSFTQTNLIQSQKLSLNLFLQIMI